MVSTSGRWSIRLRWVHGCLVCCLAPSTDLFPSVRQLKRWAVKWGFFKHISDSEMRKMVRTREKRQEQLGRPTKFLRKLAAGEGDFQEVPQAKLDAYQKRFGAAPSASPMSQYSS